MSNTTHRTAQTTIRPMAHEGKPETRYETSYRFTQREWKDGWQIVLTDPSAIRTVETESFVTPTDTTTGMIGWLTKSTDGGWTLHHAPSGTFKSEGYGIGYRTREEAVDELMWLLISGRLYSPASEGTHYLASDTVDHNELVVTASKIVDRFDWEIKYDEIVAHNARMNGGN